MNKSVVVLLTLISFSALSQTEFDGSNWKAPYSLGFPEGWAIERFLIPIEFAPKIPYRGVEDLRFMPGWGNAKSDEYWSYSFLWYLDEMPVTNETTLQTNLTTYYTGLIGRNIERRKIPADKLFPVKTSVKEVKTEPGDLKTFHGTISMLDYMEQKPIILNCVIHIKSCDRRSNGFLFYEISPKPMTDAVWEKLDALWKNFNCKKPEIKK